MSTLYFQVHIKIHKNETWQTNFYNTHLYYVVNLVWIEAGLNEIWDI